MITLTIKEAKPMRTKVNDQEGYWIRARIHDGAFGVEGELEQRAIFVFGWTPQVTFAPVMQNLKVKTDYTLRRKMDFRAVEHLFSRVDETWRLLAGPLDDPQTFDRPISSKDLDAKAVKPPLRPFDAADEGPALYLGFERAFPAGQWIRVLFDVEESTHEETAQGALAWQYWQATSDERKWQPLGHIVDETRGLVRRNYLGFYAPADHGPSTEFGQKAYWIRATYTAAPNPPQAVVVGGPVDYWAKVTALGGHAAISLPDHIRQLAITKTDSEGETVTAPKPSEAFLIRYPAAKPDSPESKMPDPDAGSHALKSVLRHRSFVPGPDSSTDTLVRVPIDASPSKPGDPVGRYITKYILRCAAGNEGKGPADRNAEEKQQTPRRLRGIRLNTVSATTRKPSSKR